MGFARTSQLLTLVGLSVATATSASAAPVTLSSGASRNCTGQMSMRMVDAQGQPVATGAPETEAMSETLSVRLADGRYELRHTTTDPEGETLLIAQIRPDGSVIDATISGAGTMGMTGDPLRQLAMFGARAIPERLVAGRDFRPGDGLYTDADTQAILGGMAAMFGLPADIQLESTGNMPLTESTGEGANRTLSFAGPATFRGSGRIGGQMMEVEMSGEGTTVIDATTGLLRASSMEANIGFKAGGVALLGMHMRMSLTCIITAGTPSA